MRRLLLLGAPLALVCVVGAGGSATAAVRSHSVAVCLSEWAEIKTSNHGPKVRALFRDGTEVRLWFYATPGAARLARPIGTFNWNATRENVGYVWSQKPSLNQRIALKFCITPPSAMSGGSTGPVTGVRGGQAGNATQIIGGQGETTPDSGLVAPRP